MIKFLNKCLDYGFNNAAIKKAYKGDFIMLVVFGDYPYKELVGESIAWGNNLLEVVSVTKSGWNIFGITFKKL